MRRLLAPLACLLALASLVATPRGQSLHAPLGTNLSRLDDWSAEYAFTDAFKESRPWFSGTPATFDDGRPIDVDEHGWLRSLQQGQIAKTLMMNAVGLHYPAGRYTVTWDGDATVQWGPAARILESSPGRQLIEVDRMRRKSAGIRSARARCSRSSNMDQISTMNADQLRM
jgi:hypothetical protein